MARSGVSTAPAVSFRIVLWLFGLVTVVPFGLLLLTSIKSRTDVLKGAFALEPARTEKVRGRRVVLVDDVMTSGASLFTAARVLREAGAAHVAAIVFARTDKPGAAG